MSWDLFGTERDKAWRAFAERVGGTYDAGHLLRQSVLVAPFGAWRVHMTTYDASGGEGTDLRTQALVELGGKLRLELHVRPSSALDGIADWFVGPEVTVGDAPFDAAFHIRCNDARIAAEVLTPSIRGALVGLARPTLSVGVESSLLSTHQPSRVRVEVEGVVRDVDTLGALWLLTVEVAESLSARGVIPATLDRA